MHQSDLYDVISRACQPPGQIAAPAAHKPVAGSPLVLIAEDNEINSAVAQAMLDRCGVRSEIARNGREAVEMAAANGYAAIFMDCEMPELDGCEATREIRGLEGSRHVPIIAMTALSMPGDRERCLAAGMDDYIAKPIHLEQLDELLARWVSNGSAPERLAHEDAERLSSD